MSLTACLYISNNEGKIASRALELDDKIIKDYTDNQWTTDTDITNGGYSFRTNSNQTRMRKHWRLKTISTKKCRIISRVGISQWKVLRWFFGLLPIISANFGKVRRMSAKVVNLRTNHKNARKELPYNEIIFRLCSDNVGRFRISSWNVG